MFSVKNVLLGSLAVGGVAVVGYYAYQYYTDRSTSLLEVEQAETRQKKEKTVKKILKNEHTVREKESAEQHAKHYKTRTANQVLVNRATKRQKRFESTQNQVKHFTKSARLAKSRSQSEKPEIQDIVAQEAVQTARQAKAKTHQEETELSDEEDEPWQPKTNLLRLQHVRTAEELDTTFQALACHYFANETSVEEFEAAKEALGWAWPLVLEGASRLPQNVSSSSVPDTETELSSSLDCDNPLPQCVTYSSVDTEEDLSSSLDEGGYENGMEDSSSDGRNTYHWYR